MEDCTMNTSLQCLLRICALCLACWSCGAATAHAQDVTGTLNTAWESFWQQSGYPRPLFKWQTPLRVRFSGVSAERHKEVTLRHLRKTVQAMEAFGNGTGEAPTVIVRSGKAAKQGMERGQVEIQYFLGLAYLRGHIVTPDKDKALGWLHKAAAAHGGAATQIKSAARQSTNIED
jgi:hypothetical protein